MEDELHTEPNPTDMPVPLKNVEVNVAEEPKLESDEDSGSKPLKVNGDTKLDHSDAASESSDYDHLVIDERPLYNRKRKQCPLSPPEHGFKGFKRVKSETEDEYEPPTNPYFNESLFELSELHNKDSDKGSNHEVEETRSNVAILSAARKGFGKKKKLGSPKLREYAQYLGLQPTVQFKCSRCTLKGFASLALLNEHQLECTGEGPVLSPTATTTTAPSTNFRVTRKVYLCSACGTYYENWNLFLHMREIHKRFICLYCLGMFSQSEKLSLHLVTKHNCVPSQLNSEEDFFHVYKEPCYLMCCECEKVFSEQDNFFGHTCCSKPKVVSENKTKNNSNKSRQLVVPKQVTTNPKQVKSKNFVEHVTADTLDEQGDVEPNEPQVEPDEPPPLVEPMEAEPEQTDQVATANDNLDATETTENNDEVDNLKSSPVDDEEEISPEKLSDNEQKALESDPEPPPDSPKYDSPSPQNPDEQIPSDHETPDTYDQEDTRKVPKVTLKLRPPMQPYLEKEESNDSEKLTVEAEPVDEPGVNVSDEKENKDPLVNLEPALTVAGSDVPIVELQLEHPLDKFDIQILLQKCLRETIPVCVYCNHARKIAVNGKQLGLHAIAEHRFSAIVNSITAEELIPESFVMRIRESLPDLQNLYFNLESVAPDEGLTFSHVYECFQCRYATTVHKELYLHNRKMHAKTILLCIMCKSNFYSYSELICHLCPGVYELNNDIMFRCCMCVCDDLPSAFRLMVHLRKRHHACDVCLELCHSQSKLSNHVWKHKLHHLCYRCGIAYRNKPDITKHLFWKHGTESVLCKKCLQKKWPHIYHFCIPPSSFTCEECNMNFTKAVALKVHKRLHREENPHQCGFENCSEKFISKKLLLKHEFKHREPPEEIKESQSTDNFPPPETLVGGPDNHSEEDHQTAPVKDENSEDIEKSAKPQVDVYDLPELNLSESDSDSEDEAQKPQVADADPNEETPKKNEIVPERVSESDVGNDSVVTLDNIWDDFKMYQASKEKIDGGNEPEEEIEKIESELPKTADEGPPVMDQQDIINIVMMDHDYSLLSQEYKVEPKLEDVERSQSMDHDYCSSNNQSEQPQEENIDNTTKPPGSPPKIEKKERKPSSTSGSSNDSDSSSCTCRSNCSCSSSGSSSSSSDSSDSDSSSSEGRRKQQARRERRKQRTKNKKESETSAVDVVATDNQIPPPSEQHIEESDLDTTETETDEDFYDKQPQKLANKLIAEKRKELMLLAEMGSLTNGAVLESSRPSTPSLPETEALKLKKKSKNKKKKKKKRQSKPPPPLVISTTYCQPPIVSPLTISLSKNTPFTTPSPSPTSQFLSSTVSIEPLLRDGPPDLSDASLRASKRRRIPNKFYGYSSDEEQDKHQPPVLKWRKMDLPSPARPTPNSPLVVPPITIKTLPPPAPLEEPFPNRLNEVPLQEEFVPTHPPDDSGSESNESSSEDEPPQPPPLLNRPPNQPPLYCYCRCPYDEVSEMIGCDADDCLIEWFHFECVGIMVPPKGQWFCPECRKKKQQRKELALM